MLLDNGSSFKDCLSLVELQVLGSTFSPLQGIPYSGRCSLKYVTHYGCGEGSHYEKSPVSRPKALRSCVGHLQVLGYWTKLPGTQQQVEKYCDILEKRKFILDYVPYSSWYKR